MKKAILFCQILLIIVFVFSCKSKKKLEQNKLPDSILVDSIQLSKRPISPSIDFYQKVLPQSPFEQIKINSKIIVETPDRISPEIDATIYIEKETKIWMNVSMLFFNVARGLATQDGLKVYIKTDKTYIDSDFQYINQLLNTNFINYKSLEKLIMGKVFVNINSKDFWLYKTNQGYKMKTLDDQILKENPELKKHQIEMQFAENYDLQSISVKEKKSENELLVNYSNWEDYKDFRVPKNVKIIIKGEKPSQISIENTKFDDSKMNTPFSIPSNYKKIDI